MKRPRIGVFKFASCDGCQLQFLNMEDELLALAELVDFAYFPEARSRALPGPYDVAFVEGSISTPDDADRIVRVRADSRFLVTIGACATAGGIQALRNWANVDHYRTIVYPTPEFVAALPTSTPIAEHVRVDYQIWGCPVDRRQVLAVLRSLLSDARPTLPAHSVCMECKRRGNVCVVVARGEPCMGPVTRTGCGALCPAFDRGCYGCFGPADDTNMASFERLLASQGIEGDDAVRRIRGINGWVNPWREASHAIAEKKEPDDRA
jgi:coenzyme F420-reducing hydrogenase gamma subunit